VQVIIAAGTQATAMTPFPPAHDGAPAVDGITGVGAARGFDTLLSASRFSADLSRHACHGTSERVSRDYQEFAKEL
jgi:hypothetical protein